MTAGLSDGVAGGTPWKGRLRSYHTTTQSLPSRKFRSQAKNQEMEDEAQALKKHSGAKNTGSGCNAGAVRRPRTLQCQPLQPRGRNQEHPIVIEDEVNEGYKVRDDQSAMMPLRRSPRFHQEDRSFGKPLLPPNCQETSHKRKAQNAIRKDKNHGSLEGNMKNDGLKPFAKMNSRKKPQILCQDPQDIPTRKKVIDVSHMKSDKQERKSSNYEVVLGKRKRSAKGRSSEKKRGYKEPKRVIHRKIEKGPSIVVKPKAGHERLTKIDANMDEPSGIEREGIKNLCDADDWTEEQDVALRKAYFTARPSPHFWKRVSKLVIPVLKSFAEPCKGAHKLTHTHSSRWKKGKSKNTELGVEFLLLTAAAVPSPFIHKRSMEVPGRSAEDCFNRIHADLSTPTPIGPRPRTSKTTFSPIGNFSLSDPKLPNLLESTVGRQRTAKQKSLAAQKTVRHLLQKHCLKDRAQEADHFSLFETSPRAFQLNISFEDSPGTPESYLNSGSLDKCSGSSSARKKSFSRLRAKQAERSPAVLKPIKNVILHEKYVDQLSRREGTKRPRKRTPGSKQVVSGKTISRQQAGGLKAAKNALISEATDFISQFKKLQANSLAHIVENDEHDGGIECDASDSCHDDDDEA